MKDALNLSFNFQFNDLFSPEKLKELHKIFLDFIENKDANLKKRYAKYCQLEALSYQEEGALLIELSLVFSDFIVKFFGIEKDFLKLKEKYSEKEAILKFKNDFVRKIILPKQKQNEPPISEQEELRKIIENYYSLFKITYDEHNEEEALSQLTLFVLEHIQEGDNTLDESILKRLCLIDPSPKEALSLIKNNLIQYVYALFKQQENLPKEEKWASFCFPKIFDPDKLISTEQDDDGSISSPSHLFESREGFSYANKPLSSSHILGELDYCLKCHRNDRDFCSRGARDPKTEEIKINELSVKMSGCPLNQKISHSHSVARQGEIIAALSLIMIDNPMCPGTGDRICSDCLTSCVYIKQDSVAIPQNESAILHEVVYKLPYGAEIYSLLTRWNPLNRKRPHMLEATGKKVLIAGCGPAGYTLSHYLSNEGVFVTVIDALKLEPLPSHFFNEKGEPSPIKHFKDHTSPLEERTVYGFGGVSEYGITVRFDKNLLLLLYVTLSRKKNIQFFGGIRFGSNLNIQDAWDMGYHHIALATGAGKPKDLDFEEHSPVGVSKASDFLMSLQSVGVFKSSSLASLDVRLPAVVIGGGLTAVDTATELMAYYPVMVKKIAERYERIDHNSLYLSETEKEQLKTYLNHAHEIRTEEEEAKKESRKPNLVGLLRKWGGVKLIYRGGMKSSQAYKLSSIELEKALHEGLIFYENLSPKRFHQDAEGRVISIEFEDELSKSVSMEAKSVFVSIGTEPNTVYEKEYPGTFTLTKGQFFSPSENELFFSSYKEGDKRVSFFGDLHPNYVGKVVRAMASAKHGYSKIIEHLETLNTSKIDIEHERKIAQKRFLSVVHEVKKLSKDITEITIENPLIAKRFRPGQFYKLQNFETNSRKINEILLSSEPLALTGTNVNLEKNLISFIILEIGVSSKIISNLKKGDPLICMGPIGSPTLIPKNEVILLLGGGLGNAVLFSILKEAKQRGNKIVYFSAYRKHSDMIHLDFLKEHSNELILSCDEKIDSTKEDIYHGNLIESLQNYLKHLPKDSLLKKSTQLILIGSSGMMQAFKNYFDASLFKELPSLKKTILSINSPMQCMMKEVCGRCLQKHIDPKTGKISYVYSCLEQDQDLKKVDLTYLNQKLKEHSISEKINHLYLELLQNK